MDEPAGAICGGTGRRFLARVRVRYARRYTLLGNPVKSYKIAWHRLGDAMATKHYKCGEILLVDDYYEPVVIHRVDVQSVS